MNILLLNPHSPQNAGDLAILQESLACLRAAHPDARISVTINDPRPEELLPPGAEYLESLVRWLVDIDEAGRWHWHKRRAPLVALWLLLAAFAYRAAGLRLLPRQPARRRLMTAFYDADLVVVFGGGHLYARHGANISFLWLALGLALAIIMGKPLVMLPQSLGPVAGRAQRRLLRWLVERSSLVAAREFRSLRFLHQIGVRRPVQVLPDLAFTTAEAPAERARELLAPYLAGVAPARPLVGFTLMDWGSQNDRFQRQERYEAAVRAAIAHLQDRYGAEVVVFSQCFGPSPDQDDRRIARRVAAQLAPERRIIVVDEALSPQELKAAYRQMRAMVATRMHSAIFALCAEVPTLVIGYLHKSEGIMETLGLERYAVAIDKVEPEPIRAMIDQLWADQEPIRARLRRRIPALSRTLEHLPRLIREVTA